MTNPSIILKDGSEIPEGLMDAFITTAAALHDLKNKEQSDSINSLTSIWGIGNWTAKMFLIFGLNNIDVFINEDFGIKKSMKKRIFRT